MLEELQQRNYATTTVYYDLKAVEYFSHVPRLRRDRLNRL